MNESIEGLQGHLRDLTVATAWLIRIRDLLNSCDLLCPEPWVNFSDAEADDDIVFEWWRNTRKLTFYVSTRGVECIKVWGPDMNTEMEVVETVPVDEARGAEYFLPLWTWLNEESSPSEEDEETEEDDEDGD